jgi:hypothetical protein
MVVVLAPPPGPHQIWAKHRFPCVEAIATNSPVPIWTQDTFSVKVAGDFSLVETSCHDGLSQKRTGLIENYVPSQANRTPPCVFADRSAGLTHTTVFNARDLASPPLEPVRCARGAVRAGRPMK